MKASTTSKRGSRVRGAKSPSVDHRTSSPRKLLVSLMVIPVRLDQSPGDVRFSSHASFDPSGQSLAIMLDRTDSFAAQFAVVGANLDGPGTAFAMMMVQSQQLIGDQRRIDLSNLKDPAMDILSEQHLAPRIDAKHFRIRHGYPEDVLAQWESLGVFRKYLVDRILVCPQCGSIPTWRHACPKCGSARHQRTRLVHHFACAHVDHADSFQSTQQGLRCPKCRATGLIAGTDFQYVAGPLNCFDCELNGGQPVLSCLCHCCLQRFDPSSATEQELHGYHVDRLDLLDLVVTSE
jgi:hypothetical protein